MFFEISFMYFMFYIKLEIDHYADGPEVRLKVS